MLKMYDHLSYKDYYFTLQNKIKKNFSYKIQICGIIFFLLCELLYGLNIIKSENGRETF